MADEPLIDVNGTWWLADAPNVKRSGRLRVATTGKATLSIEGHFKPWYRSTEPDANGELTRQISARDRDGLYARISGETGAGAGYTLENCVRIQQGPGSERIHASAVYTDVHFDADEQAVFDELIVEMDWLSQWLDQSGLRRSGVPDRDSEWVYQATLLKVSPTRALAHDGTVLAFHQDYKAPESHGRIAIHEGFHLRVTPPEPRPLTDLMQHVNSIRALVSIGTEHVAAIHDITLFHHQVRDQFGYLQPIRFIAEWRDKPTPDAPRRVHWTTPFTFNHIGRVSGLERWLRANEGNRSIIDRVVAANFTEGMFASDRLLNVAAAIEAYDKRKHPGKKDLIVRVRRCARIAGPMFEQMVGDSAQWCETFANYRHDVAHHLPAIETTTVEHYIHAKAAYWLLIMCLLRDASVPDSVLEHIARLPSTTWVRDEVVGVAD